MSHDLSRRQKDALLGAVNDPDGVVELSLGDRALTKGYLTADALKSCLDEQSREPRLQLGQILVQRGHVTKAQLAELMGTRESFPAAFIGRFRLRRALSRGGMGVVYEAEDSLLRRRVAVKVLREDAGLPASLKERLQREAVAIARLRHPNIVALYEYGSAGGLHYLVMEMVDGETLAHAMPGFKRAPKLAAAFMARVCEAIEYAHDQGVIHRDLKPKNIMIDKEGVPKVVDFGLSIVEDASSVASDGLMAGTIAYMPPEQLAGTSHVAQPAWDVYALGATLYEMLTGRLPFPGTTAGERMGSILTRQLLAPSRYNPGIPHALEAIVMRALDRDPRQRYATAREMAMELRHYLGGGRVEAEGDWRTNLVRSLRANKRRLLAAGVLAVAMIVAIALSWSAWRSGRSSSAGLVQAARGEERARSALELGDADKAALHAEQAGSQYWRMRTAITRWVGHDAVEPTPLQETRALAELRQGARTALDKVEEESLEQWKKASLPGLRALANGDYARAADLLDMSDPEADANLSYVKAYALLRAHRSLEACAELEATFLLQGIHRPHVVALYARAVAALAMEEGLGYQAIREKAERILALPGEQETHAALADLRSVLAQRAVTAGRPDLARKLLEEAYASQDRAASVHAATALFELLARIPSPPPLPSAAEWGELLEEATKSRDPSIRERATGELIRLFARANAQLRVPNLPDAPSLLETAARSSDPEAREGAASALSELVAQVTTFPPSPSPAQEFRLLVIKETERALQWADAPLCVAYVSFLARTGALAPNPTAEAKHLLAVVEKLPPAVRALPSVAMGRAEALSRLGQQLGAWDLAKSIKIPPEETLQRLRLFDLLLELARREIAIGGDPNMLDPARAQIDGLVARGLQAIDAQLRWGEYWHAVASSRVRRGEDASDAYKRTLEHASAAINSDSGRDRGHHLKARSKRLQALDPKTPESNVIRLLKEAESECTAAYKAGWEEAQVTRGEVRMNLARCEELARRDPREYLAESVRDLESGCNARPERAESWTCLAEARIHLGRVMIDQKKGIQAQEHFEKAVKEATRALELRQREVRALDMRSLAFEYCGRRRDAQGDLRALIEIVPERREELEQRIARLD